MRRRTDAQRRKAMARYRKISTVIWNDAKFRALSDDAQFLFLFILTHPHMTSVGAMRATIDGLAAEKGWPRQRLAKAFREALTSGLIEFDERASCLIVPKFLKHNSPESANVVTSWGKALELIPECLLKGKLYEILECFVDDLPEGYQKAFARLRVDLTEDFGKAMPNPEQEQEQEQDKEYKEKSGPTESQFERFWKAYPARNGRKLRKPVAREKFMRLSPEDAELAILAAENYSGEKQVLDGYAKDPERFLSAGTWRDYLTPTQSASRVPTAEDLANYNGNAGELR